MLAHAGNGRRLVRAASCCCRSRSSTGNVHHGAASLG
jgi:hypothetical protein